MAAFADPVLLTIIALVVGLYILIKFKPLGLPLVVLTIFVFYLISTPLVSRNLLFSGVGNAPEAPLVTAAGPAAIVILGGDIRTRTPEFKGDTVGQLSLERIRYGAHVHRQLGLPVLTTGGLIGDSELSIGEAMADTLLEDFQVQVRWVEKRSRNTFENARRSAEILEAVNISTIYLVTHSWHMPRSIEAFEHFGLTVMPTPTGSAPQLNSFTIHDLVPNTGALQDSAYALHEKVGRVWYNIRYY